MRINFRRYSCMSPPTRAEWIEIEEFKGLGDEAESPPTRAEWIEISHVYGFASAGRVSAHTGGVD